jgi:hypothetical protein
MHLRIAVFIITLTCLVSGQDEIERIGHFPPLEFWEWLDVEVYSENIVYVFGVGGVLFLDVADPSNPILIGRYDPGSDFFNRFYNVKATEDLALGAARTAGLYFIDISDIRKPELQRIYKTSRLSYESVDQYQNYAYAAVHENGIEIIDISDLQNPTSTGILSGFKNAWDVYITNGILLVADGIEGLKICTLIEPQSPQFLSSIKTNGQAREVIVDGDYAYVALGAEGFDIIDISNPTEPHFVGNFNNGFGLINHLSYSNGYIFTSAWESINAVDVSNPANPFLEASKDTPYRAMGIASIDNRIFVADWFSLPIYEFTPQIAPDIHVKPYVYDFGFKGANIPSIKEFNVYNLGESTLDINNIKINSPYFEISPPTLSVPPGEQRNITVSFISPDSNNLIKKMEFHSNDPDESQKKIPIYAGTSGIPPGVTAPDFRLNDLSEKLHSLSDYRGKIVVLAFFSSW